MHDLKSTPKRYQNPEVFEQLAMEYAVGSLQGRARDRFEVLMDTHFYLRAIVDAYEMKFANLVELLPEKSPTNNVWNNIEAHIKESTAETAEEAKEPWWKTNFFKQGFSMAMMAMIVAVVYVFDPMTGHKSEAIAYSAIMESGNNSQMMAVTKIQKSDMKLSIDIMKPMAIDEGMELTLWCHPKTGGKPMKMGTISKSGKTELSISKDEWENLANIGQLKVSLEMKGQANITTPSDKILLQGQLSSSE